jgi:SEFIR domain
MREHEHETSNTSVPAKPRAFISYSHDSAEHSRRVRALADRLRSDGIEAWIDQYVQDPSEGWIRWMRTQVKEANRVLLVFTETYQRRFEGGEEEGNGLGATFEGAIVTHTLYESGGWNAKFRPVVFGEEEERFIPIELRCFNRYSAETPDHYQNLLRWLHGAPRIVVPPVGDRPDLSPEPALPLFSPNSSETAAKNPSNTAENPELARRSNLECILAMNEHLPSVFIGSSTKGLPIAEAIEAWSGKYSGCQVAGTGKTVISYGAFEWYRPLSGCIFI